MRYMSCEIRYPRLVRGVIPDISFLKWMTSCKGTIQRSNVSPTRVSAIFLETSRNLSSDVLHKSDIPTVLLHREAGRRG
jgi:hypothetical protein